MKQLPQKARFGDARETLRRPGEGWRGFLRRLAEHSGAMPCGGARACGKCAVQLLPPEAAPSPSPDDMRLLGTERVRQGWRLLCGLLASHGIEAPWMTASLRGADPSGTQIVTDFRMDAVSRRVSGQPGTRPGRWALAVDLGTTTVAGALVPADPARLDTEEGAPPLMLSGARLNGQLELGGPDVMSRIARAQGSPEMAAALSDALRETVEQLVRELLQQYGVDARLVDRVALCGNTTMEYFFLGRDVSCLGMYPFEPPDHGPFEMDGLFPGLPGPVRQWLFPVPGGFIGGDIVAGLLALRNALEGRRVLFMDLGTNGEIVLWDRGKILAAGTAAGPAFEGARIACGSPALRGAIERVRISPVRLRCGVIGGGRARSLCGSGLVDLCAGLLRLGGITPDGRLRDPEDPLVQRVPVLRKRIYADVRRAEPAFTVAGRRGSGVWLGQRDVREFQLAVAAIRGGVRLLMDTAGVATGDLDQVIIAGGYGFHLDAESAAAVGLIPAGAPPDRVARPGNTALAGAAMVAADPRLAPRAKALAESITVLNLADHPAFTDTFVESMHFPAPVSARRSGWDCG